MSGPESASHDEPFPRSRSFPYSAASGAGWRGWRPRGRGARRRALVQAGLGPPASAASNHLHASRRRRGRCCQGDRVGECQEPQMTVERIALRVAHERDAGGRRTRVRSTPAASRGAPSGRCRSHRQAAGRAERRMRTRRRPASGPGRSRVPPRRGKGAACSGSTSAHRRAGPARRLAGVAERSSGVRRRRAGRPVVGRPGASQIRLGQPAHGPNSRWRYDLR